MHVPLEHRVSIPMPVDNTFIFYSSIHLFSLKIGLLHVYYACRSRSCWCKAEQKFVHSPVPWSLPPNVEENILMQYRGRHSRSEGTRMLRGH